MSGKGFTLIELLIVVAIIAILAAIAVPNFLEAQTRARVSRVNADMRAIATALEAYSVDNNNYPLIHYPSSRYRRFTHYLWVRSGGVTTTGVMGLTSPVAYISTIPGPDPFRGTGASSPYYYENQIYGLGSSNQAAYHYINVLAAYKDKQAYGVNGPAWSPMDAPWHPNLTAPAPVRLISRTAPTKATNWALFSVGPDRSHGPSFPLGYLAGAPGSNWAIWDQGSTYETWTGGPSQTESRGPVPYDPSNGTNSAGDIWKLSD